MADLIDRISGDSLLENPPRPKLNSHRFIGLERLYALGVFTRQQISTELDLQGSEATQASQLADQIDAQSNALNKLIYIGRIEGVIMCIEDRNDTFFHSGSSINKPQVYSTLQIVG